MGNLNERQFGSVPTPYDRREQEAGRLLSSSEHRAAIEVGMTKMYAEDAAKRGKRGKGGE